MSSSGPRKFWWTQKVDITHTLLNPRHGFLCLDVVRLLNHYLRCCTHHLAKQGVDVQQMMVDMAAPHRFEGTFHCHYNSPTAVVALNTDATGSSFVMQNQSCGLDVWWHGFAWVVRWQFPWWTSLDIERSQLAARLAHAFPRGCLSPDEVKCFLLEYLAPGWYVDYRLLLPSRHPQP